MAEEDKKEGFEKKEIIFSESLGVCRIDDVVRLSPKKREGILYYVLRSLADKTKVAYIPVEEHAVLLRRLIDRETAEEIKNTSYKELPVLKKQEVDYVLLKAQEK